MENEEKKGADTITIKTGTNGDLKNTLELFEADILKSLPKHILTPHRFTQLLLQAARKSPKIYSCSPLSVLGAFMTCVQLGLEPNSPLGQAFLVPYWNKNTNSFELQFQIGYKGAVDLGYRSPKISLIEAAAVYEGEEFSLERTHEGTKMSHMIQLTGSKKIEDVKGYYTLVTTVDGFRSVNYMSKEQIEDHVIKTVKLDDNGKPPKDSPWNKWPEAMAKKTVFKNHVSFLPQSPELALALQVDSYAEMGKSMIYDPETKSVVEGEASVEPTKTREQIISDSVKNRMNVGGEE